MATEHAWEVTPNQVSLAAYTDPLTGDEINKTFKNHAQWMLWKASRNLIAAGWTVVRSSNSVASADSDLWDVPEADVYTTVIPAQLAADPLDTTQKDYSATGRSWIVLASNPASEISWLDGAVRMPYYVLIDFGQPVASSAVDFGAWTNIKFSQGEFLVAPGGSPTRRGPRTTVKEMFGRYWTGSATLTALKLVDNTLSDVGSLHFLKDTTTGGFYALLTRNTSLYAAFGLNKLADTRVGQSNPVVGLFTGGGAAVLSGTAGMYVPTTNTLIGLDSAGTTTAQLSIALPFIYQRLGLTGTSSGLWLKTVFTGKSASGVLGNSDWPEWPIPVIYSKNSEPMFLGRLADIKVSPATTPVGAMSVNPADSTQYDRMHLGGVWWPWAGSTAIEV